MNTDKFKQLIAEARALIKENEKEWKPRYNEYAQKILENIPRIKKRKKNFREWAPLNVYMNIAEAAKAAPGAFNLRYNGQSVADLKLKGGNLILNVGRRYQENTKTHFGLEFKKSSEFHWRSPEAAQFRKLFPKRAVCGKSPEHALESRLLDELEKTSKTSKDELLHYIQPVKIAKTVCRFQMPTPLKASGSAGLKYSGGKGGGIDLLARLGAGRRTSLCIMELKPKAEPPVKVMSQALAYAVFIQELLASEGGPAWFHIFGLKKTTPNPTLTVCGVMPSGKMEELFQENADLETERGRLKLRYMNIGEDWLHDFKVMNTNVLQ